MAKEDMTIIRSAFSELEAEGTQAAEDRAPREPVSTQEPVPEPEVTTEAEVSEDIYVDPYEEIARAQGWVPEDDYKGDGPWRSPREFVERGELFGKIHDQSRKIKQLEESINHIIDLNDKTYQAGYQQAMDKLKNERKEAMRDSRMEDAVEIEERMEALEKEYKEAAPAKTDRPEAELSTSDIHPRAAEFKQKFDTWIVDNAWYKSSLVLRNEADMLGELFIKYNPDATADEVYSYVDTQMQTKFPEELGQAPRRKAGPAGTRRTTSQPTQRKAAHGDDADKVSAKDLSYEQRRVYENMKRQAGIKLTADEYAKMLAKAGEITSFSRSQVDE